MSTAQHASVAVDYQSFATLSELARWNVERDIDWDKIDVVAAQSQPELLAQLRQAALIESYHPMSTLATIQLVADDVDATSILQVEQFEGFRHFWVLRRYLEAVCYEPRITDEELIGHRERNRETVAYTADQRIQVLVNFTWSEHFAGYFFKRVEEVAKDPVLARLARLIAGDEFRHAEGGYRILAKIILRDSGAAAEIIRACNNFRHYGNDIGEMPIVKENDLPAILRAIRQMQRICGGTYSDYASTAQVA